MANTNAPFGLRPIGGMGAPPNFQLITCDIAYNASAIYTGDPVMRANTGYITKWSPTTAVSQLAGIFMGCQYLSSSLGRIIRNNYWPGSDVASNQVVTGFILPANLAAPSYYLIQTDATGAAFADIGLNFDVNMGTGSTVTGRSGAYLDISTGAATATLPFRLVNLYGVGGTWGVQDNVGSGSEAGAYNWAIVAANTSGAGSTGI